MISKPLAFVLGTGLMLAILFYARFVEAAEVVELRKEPQVKQRVENAQNLRQALGLSEQAGFDIATSRIDLGGGSHIRYRQKFRGIPVWGEAIVISRNSAGKVRHVHGRLVRNLARDLTNTKPSITAGEALAAMQALMQTRRNTTVLNYENTSSELVIYIDNGVPMLSYAMSFFVDAPGGGAPGRPTFLVDAHSGQLLFEYNALTHVETGTGPGGNLKTGMYRYDGSAVWLTVNS